MALLCFNFEGVLWIILHARPPCVISGDISLWSNFDES